MAMPDPWEKHRLDEVLFSARSLSFARRRNPPERGALAQLPEEKVVLHAYVDGAWTTREALAKLSGPEPFDRGAMRCCFRMKLHDTHRSPDGKIHAPMWARAPNFVAKRPARRRRRSPRAAPSRAARWRGRDRAG